MWADHVQRWPDGAEQRGADHRRPGDAPGSWRGDGGRYLSPQDNADADKQIAALRQPEKAVTAILLQIQQDNSHGGHLEGLSHRFKGPTRLKEKIADGLENEVGSSLADAVSEINDAVRYTFSFEQSRYVGGYGEVRQRLENAGYAMIYSKNHWFDPHYKGVNTRWEAPDGGRFELQFHTSESFHAKEHLTHRSYERLRSPTTTRLEQRALKSYQAAVCSAIAEPANVADIPTIRKESQ